MSEETNNPPPGSNKGSTSPTAGETASDAGGAQAMNRRDLFKAGAALGGAALVGGYLFQKRPASTTSADAASSGPPEPILLPESLPQSKLDRPNIVLIVMDTVRADHLSCYGYHRKTTPNLDKFVAGARLFQNTMAPSCFTLPSHASMFTGFSVRRHGAQWSHQSLDKEFTTLAEQLVGAGYQTVGISPSCAFVSHRTELDRGFQRFWTPTHDYRIGASPELLQDDQRMMATSAHSALSEWFTQKYDPKKPFFLFINYFDAHQPYIPPGQSLRFTPSQAWAEWCQADFGTAFSDHMLTDGQCLLPEQIVELTSLYDDAIRFVDHKVGELLRCFKSTRLDENLALFITSDHGDHLDERHFMSHQYSLYEPLVRVPLIARYGDRFQPGVETGLAQCHDVYPTILELAGIPWEPRPGETCQSLLRPIPDSRIGISEYATPDFGPLNRFSRDNPNIDCSRFARPLKAIQRGNMKLVCAAGSAPELYNLAGDPLETRDLADQDPASARELYAALERWEGSFDHFVAKADKSGIKKYGFTESEIQTMRGMGYIQSGDVSGKKKDDVSGKQ